VYTQLRESLSSKTSGQRAERASGWRVSRNVVNLGLTSFFTDVSSEMVSTVLPLYLVFTLRMTTFQLGAVDGIYQGATALMRLVAGVTADRQAGTRGRARRLRPVRDLQARPAGRGRSPSPRWWA